MLIVKAAEFNGLRQRVISHELAVSFTAASRLSFSLMMTNYR
jgi:hypothetical protein